MRKQANRGRKDQRREKKEEETHHEILVTVDRNSFYRKLHDFLQEVWKKGQQKEKSAEILAKDATPVLSTLSTSIPSMTTRSFQVSGTI